MDNYRIKNRMITSSCNFVISLAITHDLQTQMRATKSTYAIEGLIKKHKSYNISVVSTVPKH